MYNTSTDFKNTIYTNGNTQNILVEFDDGNDSFTILTNTDISSGKKLRFIEGVNNEKDLTIGACTTSSVEFNIINKDGLLTDYDFADARVSLGLRIDSTSSSYTVPTAVYDFQGAVPVVFSCPTSAPYLLIDGVSASVQPTFKAESIFINGDIVYLVADDGTLWVAEWNGTLLTVLPTVTMSDFMIDKLQSLEGKGVWLDNLNMYEFGSTIDTYEYVPLGEFKTDRIKALEYLELNFYGLDRMTLFDVDVSTFMNALTYPKTHLEVLTALCEEVGVELLNTEFINFDAILADNPYIADNFTGKDVLRLICESAGAYGRMDRDGKLEIAWFTSQSVTIDTDKYYSISLAEYTVEQIDKLQVKASDDDIGVILGTGDNAYVIYGNPYLYGEDETAITTLITPIYDRLIAFDEFAPIVLNAICDWSIQAGDIIAVEYKAVTYYIPIYRQTVTYLGKAKVDYESTGNQNREPVSAVNRQIFNTERKLVEIETTVEGISTTVTDLEDEVETNSTNITQNSEEISLNTSRSEGNETDITSIKLTTDGIELAVNASKLQFDETGMTVLNGGIEILNNNGDSVFYADGDGNITFVGNLSGATGTFTGNLSGATGTFTELVAGVANAQRLEMGTDVHGDPFINIYDESNNLLLTLDKNGILFSETTRMVEYATGNKIGVGIFI